MPLSCKSTEYSVKMLYMPLPENNEGFQNPCEKPLVTSARQINVHQPYRGDRLDYLENGFTNQFDQHLDQQTLDRECLYALGSIKDSIILPLIDSCSDEIRAR